jgi:hypothetical protein
MEGATWWLLLHCLQGAVLLVAGPLIDQAISKQWVLDYTWTQPALQQLLLSCALAVLVNISQFMCLGRFSAVSFQVRLADQHMLQHMGSTVMCSCAEPTCVMLVLTG